MNEETEQKSRGNKQKLKIQIFIMIVICVVLLAYILVTRGPNTDAEGFLISKEGESASAMNSYITYIENNGTGYKITFHMANTSFLDPIFDYGYNAKFEIGTENFYYNSTRDSTSNITLIQNIINQTGFAEREWKYPTWTANNYNYYLTRIKVIKLNSEELSELNKLINQSGFNLMQTRYQGHLAPGSGPVEITIPKYHKTVSAYGSSILLSSAPSDFNELAYELSIMFY